MHIIITGNPVDGFEYIGPFETGAEAVDWAHSNPIKEEWWIAPLTVSEYGIELERLKNEIPDLS